MTKEEMNRIFEEFGVTQCSAGLEIDLLNAETQEQIDSSLDIILCSNFMENMDHEFEQVKFKCSAPVQKFYIGNGLYGYEYNGKRYTDTDELLDVLFDNGYDNINLD